MATPSSILAWEIPWTEASGRLQSMESQKSQIQLNDWTTPWVRKFPCRKAWQPTPVFLPGESHGRRSLAGYSLEGGKELGKTEVTEQACTLY